MTYYVMNNTNLKHNLIENLQNFLKDLAIQTKQIVKTQSRILLHATKKNLILPMWNELQRTSTEINSRSWLSIFYYCQGKEREKATSHLKTLFS